MRNCSKDVGKPLMGFLAVVLLCASGFSQIPSSNMLPDAPSVAQEDASVIVLPAFDVTALPEGTFDADAGDSIVAEKPERREVVMRSVKRTLEDQKELYRAPFKVSNFKWDLVVLGGATPLFIEDRNIETHIPTSHYTFYQATSDVSIAALGATLGGVWIYGIKGNHPHAKEIGELELETLVNTFLIYAPMQFIAGRQRPGEGNGHGDFLRHNAMNTSFPGGHAMFTFAMATVVSHEYSQKWVQALA